MEAPNIGSANASMRRTAAPRLRTAGSGVKIPIIPGAHRYMNAPLTAMIAMPNSVVSQPSRFTRSFLPAPTDCPIRVVAADPMPYPGI